MRAIDTNIVARFLLDDDPAQSAQARAILTNPAFVPHTVLLELGWLLESRFRLTRAVVAGALLHVVDLPTVTVAYPERIRWALRRYAKRGDLADLFHLATTANADAFATFDRALVGQAGPDSPVPIETLA